MSLETYRDSIDTIDDKIIKLLEKRKTYSKKIGEIKRKKNLSIFFREREDTILQRLKSNSKNLEYREIDIIYNSIFKVSRLTQQ
jgi:chorismate mutase/prephenate dehydratase